MGARLMGMVENMEASFYLLIGSIMVGCLVLGFLVSMLFKD